MALRSDSPPHPLGFSGSSLLRLGIATALVMSLASGAVAQQKPVTQDDPNAQDVAETPLTDLNVKKHEIPPVLLRAEASPYALGGRGCGAIAAQVRELDAVLGEDFDVAHARKQKMSAGHVAQSVVNSLIPFGGAISEVSGASAEKRRLQVAISAGFARRGFLKGVGEERHCPAPAHPA